MASAARGEMTGSGPCEARSRTHWLWHLPVFDKALTRGSAVIGAHMQRGGRGRVSFHVLFALASLIIIGGGFKRAQICDGHAQDSPSGSALLANAHTDLKYLAFLALVSHLPCEAHYVCVYVSGDCSSARENDPRASDWKKKSFECNYG